MADQRPDTAAGRGSAPDPPPAAATPRWVKVFAVIAAVIIVLLVILLLTGEHGPSRHRGQAPASPPSATVSPDDIATAAIPVPAAHR